MLSQKKLFWKWNKQASDCSKFERQYRRNSLVVQSLGLRASNAGGVQVQSQVEDLSSHLPFGATKKQNLKNQ